MFNLVILNTYIWNKHCGCEKLTHHEYRDKIVKYILAEGLNNYNIPLPPVISRIGKYHKDEQDSKRLCEWHFPSHIPKREGRKREKPSRCCCICSKIPGEILKGKRTSYWCEDCGKALCVVPCFKIYHTQTDYKLHAKKFRQRVLQVEGVENDDDQKYVVTTHWRLTHYTCDVSNVCNWINFVHEKKCN